MHEARLSIGLFVLSACAPFSSSSSDALARDVLFALEDSIRAGGEASVVVPPPNRSYQHQAPLSVQRMLASMLALPSVDKLEHLPRCKWRRGSDSTGMAISVTQLSVLGDSARVSVLRSCLEPSPDGTRMLTFQFEPTWILRRSLGQWRVTQTRIRIT
jgi:hypothetical protein